MGWHLLAEQVGASLPTPSHSTAAPGYLALLAVQPRRPPAQCGLGRLCSSGATGTATGTKLPATSHSQLLGLHSHQCVKWIRLVVSGTHTLTGIPSTASDALVSEPTESHRAAVFLGTAT